MIAVPSHFLETPYDGSQYPGVAVGLSSGANCQHFCYEVLRHFGFEMGAFRSSDLWEDNDYTEAVHQCSPLDLALFNASSDPFGAHVAICIGEDRFLHLSKKNGKPVIWSLNDFSQLEEYKVLIGFKRPIKSRK